MPYENPYIKKVLEHPHILSQSEDIYSKNGKWAEYFWNSHDIILEIGTGMGNFFGYLVEKNPDKNCIGMELRYKRLFQTAEKARKSQTTNFVVLKDFAEHIDQIFTNEEISQTYIFFPDPWANKEKQKINRLLQAPFLKHLFERTKKEGRVFFKTDHREYFDSTLEVIQQQGLWHIDSVSYDYAEGDIFSMEKITEFEGLYRGKDIHINYLELSKKY